MSLIATRPTKPTTPPRVAPLPGFQLYFAGSLNKVFEEDLKRKGANRLASQLLDRNVIDGWIAGRNEGLCRGYLLIDSGAFSAHTRDAEVDVDAYIEYLNSIDDDVHVFAQVDKIPGKFRHPKTREELAEAPEMSWNNYLYMRERLKSPEKLLPIFHQGEDFKWLHNILDYRSPEGDKIWYMGISPANDKPVKDKIKFIDKCFDIIKHSSNPDICTHAFGMTSLNVLEMYPFTSADSTSWLMNGANGSIMTKYGSVLVSEKSSHSPQHIAMMPKAAQREIQAYVESKGYDMSKLGTEYTERIRFNIDFLLDWAKNYRYKPVLVRQRSLI